MVTRVSRATLRRQVLRPVAVAAAVVALLAGAVAPASASHREPSLRVMTRNLYLGADLTPALAASGPAFLRAVASIYAAHLATDFAARAEAIADEIDRTGPDLIGLQEVSQWETSGPVTPTGTPPSEDYLALLQQALADRGLDYAVAAVSRNAVIGPVPLIAPCTSTTVGACQVSFTDRDVILVNESTRRLRWNNPQSGTYAEQALFTPPEAPPVPFGRGWVSIDGKFRGRPFHFVNTHLETSGFAEIQQAQAAEFLAGPAFGRGADLVVGDFNSGPAANRPSTATYGLLTDRLRDAWSVRRRAPGYTCCQEPMLMVPAPQFDQRIDLILVHGAKPLAARRVGHRPFANTPPRWASDHAGVVADVRLAKKRLS